MENNKKKEEKSLKCTLKTLFYNLKMEESTPL